MDQLETQVSDLRSFLGAAAAPQGQGSPNSVQQQVANASSVSPHDYPLRASLSVSGRDNSAHLDDPQSPPVGASPSYASSSAKRRAEDADDGHAKQQRSKRNRVCDDLMFPSLHSLCSWLTGRLSLPERSTSRLHGE
jgi:hypothetical protein